LETTLDAMKEKPPEVENLIRRIRQIKFDLQFIVAGADRKFVTGSSVAAGAFSCALRQSTLPVCSRTNYSTTSSRSFDIGYAFQWREFHVLYLIGWASMRAEDLIAESTFDYQSQALLYLPARMPDPRSPAWAEAAAAETLRLVKATSGRALRAYPRVVAGTASRYTTWFHPRLSILV